MATFKAQVEAMTSISIGAATTPTEDELSQYLKDGVIDVTNKWLLVKPQDAYFFTTVSSEQTANNSLDLNGAKIVSIVREAGVDNDWREARPVPAGMQSRVTDSSSLFFATKYNPVYTVLDNGKVNVYPAPGSNPDTFKVYYVNNVPKDKGGALLIHSHSDIINFNDSLVYLVVKYAAIKAVEAKISSYTVDEEDSELVASYANTYRALKTEYDQTFGMVAKSIMESQNPQQVLEQRGQMPNQAQEGEE